MSRRTRTEYLERMRERYAQASRAKKKQLLDEVCQMCGYHRKHAIRTLNDSPRDHPRGHAQRGRGLTYGKQTLSVLQAVWEAAGCPWSVRLKALLPTWMPRIREHFVMTPAMEAQLLAISPRQMDRRLQLSKTKLKRRIYGRTKPGRLLKHHIPVRASHWDVRRPGWLEIDLVSHSGNAASGVFIFSLNVTDIYSTWVETRAVMGKSQRAVLGALDEIFQALPFPVLGIDSDNGTEFVNQTLFRFCESRHIRFTRGRPYKKDDNAHVEQKNWTHVRRLVGWERYDSPAALAALNALYKNEWRMMMNLFQPSVKLQAKLRVGSRLRRRYGTPRTPLARLQQWGFESPETQTELERLASTCDPFALSQAIDQQVEKIHTLASHRYRQPKGQTPG